jgi:hypothetical protein
MCAHTQKAAFIENPSKIFNFFLSYIPKYGTYSVLFGQGQKWAVHI